MIKNIILILGIFSFCMGLVTISSSKRDDIAYMLGACFPGIILVIIGLKKPKKESYKSFKTAEGLFNDGPDVKPDNFQFFHQTNDKLANAFKFNVNLGIGLGIILILLGNFLTKGRHDSIQSYFLFLSTLSIGLFFWIWGCLNYMRWKGYSGWFGFFGYLFLPGLLILFCFPNRRKRTLLSFSQEHTEEIEMLLKEDHKPNYQFLLTLVPAGVLSISLFMIFYFRISNINTAEWKLFSPSSNGFMVNFPGTPLSTHQKIEMPGGQIELHKLSVKPKGKNEFFMINLVQYPNEVIQEIGETTKLLELGRQDILFTTQGQLKNERQITLNNYPGLEIEALLSNDSIIKARIYATKNHLYQVVVLVPKIRLLSDDVNKFFDSFIFLN